MERVSPNGHLGERDGRLCAELRELLDCAQVEAWQAMANGAAADWDRGFAEGVASALALLSGEDRDDLHLASMRRVRGSAGDPAGLTLRHPWPRSRVPAPGGLRRSR